MSDPGNYTVGWICAITTEFVAAQTMLDEAHDIPEYVAIKDNNTYALGRVGRHNIVIAVLPDGEYGTSSAATVARDMVHSFPNIRIGLMVGIGGGAPSAKHDIRLGDVVVSSPKDGKSGVFQYDYGKTIQEQRFETTGRLDQPPMVLRAAVNSLKGYHEMDGAQLDSIINDALSKRPRLRQKYQRQPAENDQLYNSDAVHPPNGADCSGYCDGMQPVLRSPRDEYTDDPAIHYGQIASANQLMKDARIRDKLALEEDVLCFEMEAAGLMNHFPCLVIRGVCDYADSHKNKAWQGYAAMSAAAYAKQLLARIMPNKLEHEKKIEEAIKEAVAPIETQVKRIGSQLQRDKIQDWLRPPDPSTNYKKARSERHPGSGSWLLKHDVFLSWKAGRSSCLWLYGNSGCGKTILSSTVIEHLCADNGQLAVLYFYFDFTDSRKERLEDLLRSLVSQFGILQPTCQTLLDALFVSCIHGRQQPSCDELCRLFLSMLENSGDTWIVIDALDESTSRKGGKTTNVVAWLTDILRIQNTNVRVLATSRPEGDIKSSMDNAIGSVCRLSVQGSNIAEDVRSYLRHRLQNDVELCRWRTYQSIRDKIEARVLHEADGMFRLVSCRLDGLRDCLSEHELENGLQTLPKTLGDVYQRMLENIPESRIPKTIRILQLLCFSPKPLTVTELSHAITVQVDIEPYFDPKRCLLNPKEITLYCSSLAVVLEQDREGQQGASSSESSQILQLSHLSVKEYLLSDAMWPSLRGYFQERTARLMLADVCVSYLLQVREATSAVAIRQGLPFAQYCADFWYTYVGGPDAKSDKLCPKILDLLEENGPHSVIYRILHRMDAIRPDNVDDEPRTASPLYYACFIGILPGVKQLIADGANVNAQCGEYGNALQAACISFEQPEMVKLLLEAGADVNARGGVYDYALQAAAQKGNQEVVRLLLRAGADVNAKGDDHDSALINASERGHLEVAKLLLDSGADVNAEGYVHYSALMNASERGHLEVAKLLLDSGADVNAEGDGYNSALIVASERDHLELAKLLLDSGVDVNAGGDGHDSALIIASDRGHLELVKLLLDSGADVNAKGDDHDSALIVASERDHLELAKLLLDSGADVNAEGDGHHSALMIASDRGSLELVKLLLDAGANVNLGSPFGTALEAAFNKGHDGVVKLLLDNINELDTPGGVFTSTLLARFYGRGNDAITALLLKDDISVASLKPDELGCSFLHSSARYNSNRGIRLALENGMDVNEPDNQCWTPLHWAAYFDSVQAIQGLIEAGADTARQDWQGWTPECIALFSGNGEAKQILSAAGTRECQSGILPGLELGVGCDSCGHDLIQMQHHCTICREYDLCFRCIRDVDVVHPEHVFTSEFRYGSKNNTP